MLGIFKTQPAVGSGMKEQKMTDGEMLKAIRALREGKVYYLGTQGHESSELEKEWNRMVDALSAEKQQVLLQVNSLLAQVTKMDMVKKMVDDVRIQKESMQTIAANSEEMSSSIDEVSARAQVASEHGDEAVNVAAQGSETVAKAFSFVGESFEAMDAISGQLDEVVNNTQKIGEVIDIIKGIADQTNLLALNAAIEAARAGEQGRGFAVVADEVRKLAEHTKESVIEIQGNIEKLQAGTQGTVQNIEEASKGLASGKNLVDGALLAIETMRKAVLAIDQDITQIAANNEEQAASSQEVAAEISSAAAKAENVLRECDTTGRGVFDLSQVINQLRVKLLGKAGTLDQKAMLEVCIVDHLIWRWRVYNMLLGYETIDLHTIGTHKDCRLGEWYYGEKSRDFRGKPAFSALENPHIGLHQMAKEAAEAYHRKDIRAAEEALRKMDLCSKELIHLLEELNG